MKTYREKLTQLETKLIKDINTLTENNPPFTFLTQQDIDSGEDLGEYLELRSDVTGSVYDIHLVAISVEGIEIVEAEDTSKTYTVRLNDFADISNLITIHETLLKKLG